MNFFKSIWGLFKSFFGKDEVQRLILQIVLGIIRENNNKLGIDNVAGAFDTAMNKLATYLGSREAAEKYAMDVAKAIDANSSTRINIAQNYVKSRYGN